MTKEDEIPFRLGRVGIREIPDLSWQLTRKEAAEFAILKGYPEHLFTDLLSDTPTAAATSNNVGPAELKESDRVKLLRIIGLLAETLADTNPCDLRKSNGGVILGNGDMGKTGKTNLIHKISLTRKKLKLAESYGLGNT